MTFTKAFSESEIISLRRLMDGTLSSDAFELLPACDNKSLCVMRVLTAEEIESDPESDPISRASVERLRESYSGLLESTCATAL